ncbi:MAG TPA: hypothetical protein VFA07_09670 [Chthonomonadaceae bacterium]|nr:hypothetical protein [Chthonomonadaceae bacterium]
MPASSHIPEERLQDYLEDRLDAAAAARVRAHLATGCRRCAHELAFRTRLWTALQADRAPATPQAVLERAFALFETRERKPSLLEQIVAVLAFDSRLQPVPAGVRTVAESASFKLLFEAGEATIGLLCARNNEHWQIAGQILTEAPPELGWQVSAVSETQEQQTGADALGEFQLRDLAPGVYDLSLRTLHREILLMNIELRPPS